MASNPFRDGAAAGAASGFNPWVMGIGTGLSALDSLFGDDKGAELQERAIALQERAYGDRAPMRALGLARLGAARPQRPDLTQDFADPSNPFYQPPQAMGFGPGYASPGASEPEVALRAKGLESLVEGGQTPTERFDALPSFAREQVPAADPRMAALPSEGARNAAAFNPALRKKIFAKMGL